MGLLKVEVGDRRVKVRVIHHEKASIFVSGFEDEDGHEPKNAGSL